MITINTDRFLLRELCEDDATERYLSWFGNSDTRKFISAASYTKKVSDLQEYIRERMGRDDILFLGIFEKVSGLHIGNIKYEPVNSDLGYAIMGILIGDPNSRGIGVGTEVLKASAGWLKLNRKIKQIILGVSKENLAAVKSYEKVGFKVAETPYIKQTEEGYTMILDL